MSPADERRLVAELEQLRADFIAWARDAAVLGPPAPRSKAELRALQQAARWGLDRSRRGR